MEEGELMDPSVGDSELGDDEATSNDFQSDIPAESSFNTTEELEVDSKKQRFRILSFI